MCCLKKIIPQRCLYKKYNISAGCFFGQLSNSDGNCYSLITWTNSGRQYYDKFGREDLIQISFNRLRVLVYQFKFGLVKFFPQAHRFLVKTMQHWYFQNLEETIIAARAQQRRRGRPISPTPSTPQYTPNSPADDFENLEDSIVLTRARRQRCITPQYTPNLPTSRTDLNIMDHQQTPYFTKYSLLAVGILGASMAAYYLITYLLL